jgi:uncharacterized protein YqgV (UPF0045/DUF77 family)
MLIRAQVAIYALRQEHLGDAVRTVVDALVDRGLSPEMGPMSTSVRGDADDIFAALRDGFIRAAADGPQVMTVTVSSGCPEES